MRDIAAIAQRAGVTEAQARAVLDAAAAEERRPPAAAQPTGFADFAVWAAAAVVVGSVAVFVVAEDGFEADPRNKGSVLAVALIVGLGALLLGRLAHLRGYPLGEQTALLVAAALVPVALWMLIWVLGLWPGHEDRFGGWVGGSDRAQAAWVALIAAVSAAAMAYPALRLDAALAWGLLLGELQVLAAALFVLAFPAADIPDGVGLVLMTLYLAAFTAFALWLERARPPRATWTWPYAWVIGGPGLATLVDDVSTEGVAWGAGLALVVAAAVLGGMLHRAQLVVAAGLAGLVLDAWLYDLLDIGAGGALVISLALGLAVIGLAVLTWRSLNLRAGIRSSS